jgi:hypothetical protein
MIKVINFGQLPSKIIFREIEEVRGITFEDFLRSKESKEKILESFNEENESEESFS